LTGKRIEMLKELIPMLAMEVTATISRTWRLG
jgi:hypothetical protein